MGETSATESCVYVVDDDPALRRALLRLFTSVGLRTSMFEAAQQFLDQYDPDVAGCLLLDLRLAGMSGVQLQQKLIVQRIQLPIIIITGNADVPTAVKTMGLGAYGFFEKPFDSDKLLNKVQEAIAFDVKNRLQMRSKRLIEERLAKLTPREREVLDLVIEGLSNKRIASLLGVTLKTVEAHRSHIMDKLQATNLASLIAMVVGGSRSGYADNGGKLGRQTGRDDS